MTNIIDTAVPKVKQYMSETSKAYSVKEIAEHLELTGSTTLGVLDIMGAFGITEKRKNGVFYYFLKDTYSEEQIKAMLLDTPHGQQRKAKPIISKIRVRPIKPKTSDSFLDEYLSDLEKRASQGNGLAALAILGLPQKSVEPLTMEPTKETESEPDYEPMIEIKPYFTVKELPKNVRRLSPTETNYLKNLLKHLGGYQVMKNLNTVFAKFSAIKSGRYGDEFYFSVGTNSWDNILKVSVNSSISDCMVLPSIEMERWSKWNEFQHGLKPKKRIKGQYDKIIDNFIESGHKLVEITVEDLDTTYVRTMLKNKIEKRNLMKQIEVSRVENWIYLEKMD